MDCREGSRPGCQTWRAPPLAAAEGNKGNHHWLLFGLERHSCCESKATRLVRELGLDELPRRPAFGARLLPVRSNLLLVLMVLRLSGEGQELVLHPIARAHWAAAPDLPPCPPFLGLGWMPLAPARRDSPTAHQHVAACCVKLHTSALSNGNMLL